MAEPNATGADMWRENAESYGAITARVISHSYLKMHEQYPDPEERLFCEQLREAMEASPNSRHVDVYMWSEKGAKLRNEGHIYNASMWANERCAEHIDDAIHTTQFGDGSHDFRLALAAVVDHYGSQRVSMVLKCAVLHDAPFGRYPGEINRWARDFSKPDHFGNFGIRTRPSVLAGLIGELRKTEAMHMHDKATSAHEQAQPTVERQSVRKILREARQAPKPPRKPPDKQRGDPEL